MKNAVIAVLGVSFIIVGVIGIFLPFLQGILFILIGLYLLSIGSPKTHAHVVHHYRRGKTHFPQAAAFLEKLEKKWEDLLERWRHQ